jgi:hypothetical protein
MPASHGRRRLPALDQRDLDRVVGYLREADDDRAWFERLGAAGGEGLAAITVPGPVRAQLAGRRLIQGRPGRPDRLILSRAGRAVGDLR